MKLHSASKESNGQHKIVKIEIGQFIKADRSFLFILPAVCKL